jgi:hypothetical protein
MDFETKKIGDIAAVFEKPIRLDIADCAWWELQRVCHGAGLDAQVTAERALIVWTKEMQRETYRKAVMGDSWSRDCFPLHSKDLDSDFVLDGHSRIPLPKEIITPFYEFATALGYNPHQLASHSIVRLAQKVQLLPKPAPAPSI